MSHPSRILLVGPLAESGRPAVGGYESANLRVLALLRQICPDTSAFPYPRATGNPLAKGAQYLTAFVRLLWQLISTQGDNAAVHFTPLCRHFLGAESLIACAARMKGYRLVLDLRAGMQESWYRKSSFLYRWVFRRLLSLATTITFEGEPYEPWLESLRPGSRRFWLPNFVASTMLRKRDSVSEPFSPRLVYVGAVSEAKGANAALLVLQLLRAQYPDATLTLIGRCDSRFLDVMKSADAAGVELTGPLTEAAMQTHLDASHFFLFLSAWFGEGHSNALTEAMARGCVPIVSRQGFSESVVGEAELVMPDRDDAAAIAAAIEAIWEKGAWPDLSDRMVSRVAEHFTDRQALAVLEQVYGEGT